MAKNISHRNVVKYRSDKKRKCYKVVVVFLGLREESECEGLEREEMAQTPPADHRTIYY